MNTSSSSCTHSTPPSIEVTQAPARLKRKRSSSPSKNISSPNLSEDLVNGSSASNKTNNSKKPRLFPLDIPTLLNTGLQDMNYSPDSCSSLFSGADSEISDVVWEGIDDADGTPAIQTVPPIPGLFFEPSLLLPQEMADSVLSFCNKTYFSSSESNQVMLFGRFLPPSSSPPLTSTSGLPKTLLDLLDTLSTLLLPILPPDTHSLLFPTVPTRARQAIINLYQQGEGITPHVDLLGRYDDGIIGVSFSSGCAMRFDKVCTADDERDERWDLYLPERSVIVLTKEARYNWTHGIDKKLKDFVSSTMAPPNTIMNGGCSGTGTWIKRGVRMSITFRWLLPGADVVGRSEQDDA